MIADFLSNSTLKDANVAYRGGHSKSPLKTMINKSAAVSLAALVALTGGVAFAGTADDDLAFDDQSTTIIQMAESYGTSVPAVEAAPPGKASNPWLIGGAMALIFGALIKLVGPNRVMNMAAQAGPAVHKTAEAIAKAPKAAAKAVGSALTTPFRFLLLVGGLAMIGFTGISIFDLQWGAGIATGIGMTAVTWIGSSRFSKTLKRQRVKVQNAWDQHRR